MTRSRRAVMTVLLAQLCGLVVAAPQARASSARELEGDSRHALQNLYAAQPQAARLAKRARAILVFPNIIKGAFVFGAQTGNGVLFVNGRVAGYYNISAASFGLQAGGKAFSYALFFITDSSLKYLKKSDGWAIGSGPSVVVVDKGAAADISSTTLTQDVYAFPFGQRGLMGGLGLEGSKITHYTPGS
jgi:lipid-binding SYLF domain-containing protein